jgi:type I restriction enzyme S subunit
MPPGWVKAQLYEILDQLTDGTHQPPIFSTNGIQFVVISNINGVSINWKSVSKWVSQETYEREARRLRPRTDDILYTAVGSYGTAVRLSDDRDFMFQRHIAFLRPNTEVIDPNFLCHVLNSPVCKQQADAVARGVAQKTVTLGSLRTFSLPLAPLPEQRRIVARIDELFAEIAEGEAALERARQGLDTWRRALLKAAVTGELTRDWREANDPAETGSDLLTRIRANSSERTTRKRRGHRTLASEGLGTDLLPELPEGWAWARLGEIVSDTLLGLDRNAAAQREVSNGTPYIKMNNISMGGVVDTKGLVRTSVSAAETLRYKLRVGDLLFNTRNSRELVGKNGIVKDVNEDTVFNNNILRLRFFSGMEPEFLNFYMCSPGFRKNLETVKRATTSVAAVYQSDLLMLPIAIPSTAEQVEIVSAIKFHTDRASDAVKLIERTTRTDRVGLQQSILKAAFEGRLVPQEPADEPASVLLARLSYSNLQTATKRRARAKAPFSHPSLPGFTGRSVDPRVKPAGED